MATEVWMRNPHSYIRELVEVDYAKIAWQRGSAIRRKIDPIKHASLYFGPESRWEVLWIGEQGAAHYKPGCTKQTPFAVYPVWDYEKDDLELLEELVAHSIGEVAENTSPELKASDETPVFGQPHRVVVLNYPSLTTSIGKQLVRHLKELQEDYPDCIIHMHGCYGITQPMGLGIKSADFEPRESASKGKVYLANGKEMEFERLANSPYWLHLFGYTIGDLRVPRMRCMYNIQSLVYAGENYAREARDTVRPTRVVTKQMIEAPVYRKPQTARIMTVDVKKKYQGDIFLCDLCRLQDKCKYYRAEAVCVVPGSEPANLAKHFNTRDANTITEGLGILMEANAKRLERGMNKELENDVLDPKVSALMNSLFNNGIKLAKLLDPSLNSPKVQVNVHGSGDQTVQIANQNPKQMVAEVVRAFELQGIKKHQITPKMISGVFSAIAEGQTSQAAIENAKIITEDGDEVE